MKELFNKLLCIVKGALAALGGIFIFLLIGALLSGSFSGDLIPIF